MPVRDRIPVNVTVPAVAGERAAMIVTNSCGCRTAKVKVAEPGQSEADDVERLEAVRDAIGPDGRIRIDANGGWDLDTAVARLPMLDRAAGGLEYAEQPCPSVEDLAALRRKVDVPIAADESVRRAEDPLRVARLEAADIVVLKVQPLGGVRACLRLAEQCGLPVVVSSALETSVGIAAGVALAAALPELAVRVRPGDRPTAHRRRGGRCPPAGGRRTAGSDRRARPGTVGAIGRLAGSGGGLAAPVGGRSMTATHAARLLVDELVRCGVRDAVLAPGSRNAPISYALAAAADQGRLRLHVRIDERSAAFLALGLAKASGRPVPVCCTSGTAAGNFLPAVLEASESGIPLVVLTADRPPELRGVGANQTIDQAGLYGGAVRSYEEVGQVPGAVVDAYVRTCVDRAIAAARRIAVARPRARPPERAAARATDPWPGRGAAGGAARGTVDDRTAGIRRTAADRPAAGKHPGRRR